MNTQSEAKRFFADKIIAEAEREGASLSEAERWSLLWSESDPEFVAQLDAQFDAHPELEEQLDGVMSDERFEPKVRRLFEAVCRRETQGDTAVRDEYRRAYRLLREHDHYIMVMIDESLARKLSLW